MPLGRSVVALQAFYILVVCSYRVATKMALRVKLEHCMDIQELIDMYVYTVLAGYTVLGTSPGSPGSLGSLGLAAIKARPARPIYTGWMYTTIRIYSSIYAQFSTDIRVANGCTGCQRVYGLPIYGVWVKRRCTGCQRTPFDIKFPALLSPYSMKVLRHLSM